MPHFAHKIPKNFRGDTPDSRSSSPECAPPLSNNFCDLWVDWQGTAGWSPVKPKKARHRARKTSGSAYVLSEHCAEGREMNEARAHALDVYWLVGQLDRCIGGVMNL